MDVRTGEILAMASLPDGENGVPLDGADPRRNRMAQDVYELGSVFKIFSFALAMQDHTTNLDETFPVGSGFKIGRYTIHDAEHMPAIMTARDILAQSSNAGTAQIALRSGPTASVHSSKNSACSMRCVPNCRKTRIRFIPITGARSKPQPSASATASW